MLARLRREFIAINMALIGLVLFAALAVSYYATWSTQRSLTSESLEQGLAYDRLGMPGGRGDGPGQGGFGMFVLVVDLSGDGVILRTNEAPVMVNAEVMTQVVQTAVSAGEDHGILRDAHVEWMRTTTDDGWRVAMADVSSRDELLRVQLVNDAIIFLVTMVALFVVVSILARWVLRPVEDAWEKQQTFIADASHELKTPLAVIIANTQILQADKGVPKESRRWVESTADEAAHMKELVNELLELARADAGTSGSGATVVREDCDLSDLVENAVLEFDAVAFERGCSIEAEVEPKVHFSCDRDWLGRALKVLLDNATKYASAGSVVRVRLCREGHRVRYSVTNQGQAISPEDLAHIFDRFYRTDKARSREASGGFGLGLAIAKGIVEAHGGSIHATSDDTGTTFSILL